MKTRIYMQLCLCAAALFANASAAICMAADGSKPAVTANAPALVAQPPSAQIQMPPPEALIIMIRSSLVALSQANITNNYQVLNALGSESFRMANSPARLAQLFAPFRTNKIDLAPVVFVTPQLSQQPSMNNGKLRLIGYFPTQPMRVDYDLQFEPSGGIWKLYGIAVNLNPAGQAQQSQNAPAKPVQLDGR